VSVLKRVFPLTPDVGVAEGRVVGAIVGMGVGGVEALPPQALNKIARDRRTSTGSRCIR
jgi:hypothetical protein